MALAAVGLKTQIWNNKLKSVLLLAGFPLLLLAMLWAFFAAAQAFDPMAAQQLLGLRAADPVQAGWEGTGRYWPHLVIGVGAWYLIATLFYQRIINAMTGAKGLARSDAPKLYDMLENLCISRGLPMPTLNIIETDALNAFATGLSPKRASITVTRGLLNALTDEEMEAVLAHELTHVINQDISLLITGIIFTGMLTVLCDAVTRPFRYGRGFRGGRTGGRGGKGAGALILIGVLILFIGRLFAMALHFALSRKREYLADAGSVELTKDPSALISALQKISHNPQLKVATEEVGQMCIMDINLAGLFSTHPPIEERIKALKQMGGHASPWTDAA